MKSALLSAVVLVLPATAMATTVYSNNFGGDSFTNAGGSNQGQAVGASGWHYNNVRNSGVAGINTTYARSGNGSAFLGSPNGSGKSDIEFLANGTNVAGNFFAAGSLGTLANLNLNALSYEWYRDSSTTTDASLHPAFRILVDADGDLSTTGDRGGLVFERAYNGGGAAPTNSWTTESITASSYIWNFGLGLGFAANINASAYAYDATLSEWQAYFPNARVLGFSMGVGSGWDGVFAGAVDNVRFGFGNSSTTYNFEAAVIPLPAAAWAGLALLSVGGVLRRHSRIA